MLLKKVKGTGNELAKSVKENVGFLYHYKVLKQSFHILEAMSFNEKEKHGTYLQVSAWNHVSRRK